jgi:hypothetical protein
MNPQERSGIQKAMVSTKIEKYDNKFTVDYKNKVRTSDF